MKDIQFYLNGYLKDEEKIYSWTITSKQVQQLIKLQEKVKKTGGFVVAKGSTYYGEQVMFAPTEVTTEPKEKNFYTTLDAACVISISPIQAWDYTVKFKTYFEFDSKRKHLSISTFLNLLEAWAIHEDFQWLVKKEGEKLKKHNLMIEAVYGLTDKLLHIRIGRRDRYGFEFASATDVFTPMGVNVDILAAIPKDRDEDEAIENAVESLIRHCSINKNKPWLVDALALADKEVKEKGLYK